MSILLEPAAALGPLSIVFHPAGSAGHRRCEEHLDRAGIPLPLTSRSDAVTLRPHAGSVFLAVTDVGGRCVGGIALQRRAPRALPGHSLLHVERLGPSLPGRTLEVAITGLASLARGDSSVLRLGLEVFSPDLAVRQRIRSALEANGFAEAADPGIYTRTLRVSLESDEEALFRNLHPTARRHIRVAERRPVVVRPVGDSGLAPRLEHLLRETYGRTGGRYVPVDWPARIELSTRRPDLSRIVGLFHAAAPGSEPTLLAFAWGCFHGDHAHYADAASTRAHELSLPLHYPLLWDLLRWARRAGASWFDLGGVTDGTTDDPNDPLGGISDFKRKFSREVVTVAEEWSLEPSTSRAWIAGRLRETRERVTSLVARPPGRLFAPGARSRPKS
jgi:hypothetical protein